MDGSNNAGLLNPYVKKKTVKIPDNLEYTDQYQYMSGGQSATNPNKYESNDPLKSFDGQEAAVASSSIMRSGSNRAVTPRSVLTGLQPSLAISPTI